MIRTWFDTLSKTLTQFGFTRDKYDDSLFFLVCYKCKIYAIMYVDEIIRSGLDSIKMNEFINLLNVIFLLKDMGTLHYFLGIEVSKLANGYLLLE